MSFEEDHFLCDMMNLGMRHRIRRSSCALLIVLGWCVIASTSVRADSVAADRAWVAASHGGGHLFKMVPGVYKWVEDVRTEVKPPFGVAYEIGNAGEFKEIWRAKGWYSREGYLSDDGRYFVRLGGWPVDFEGLTDLAVAFYDQGRLVKQYQIKDLIKNRDALVQTASHYNWRPEVQGRPDGFVEDAFELVLGDKTRYVFDFTSGAIRRAEVDAAAKTMRELHTEASEAAQARGTAAWGASPLKPNYEAPFTVTGAQAGWGKIYRTHFDGPEWRAEMQPRVPLALRCTVHPVFPLLDGDRIDCQIPASEVVSALQVLVKLPSLQEKFGAGGVKTLHLSITGDRLHWDTERLRELLKKQGREQELASPEKRRAWAQVSVTLEKREYKNCFVQVKSGEILWE